MPFLFFLSGSVDILLFYVIINNFLSSFHCRRCRCCWFLFFLRNILSALWHSSFTSFLFCCLPNVWLFLELFPLLFFLAAAAFFFIILLLPRGRDLCVCDGGIKRGEVRKTHRKKKVEIINTRTFCLLSLALSLYFFLS